MSATAMEILGNANTFLQKNLTLFQPERTRCSSVRAEDLSALCTELGIVAGSLEDMPQEARNAPGFQRQLNEFRGNLEQLRQLLPGFHDRLLAEQSRLAMAKVHSAAAIAWAQANKKTL